MKANKRMLPVVRNEKDSETAGPKIGKRKINNRIIIPPINRIVPIKIMLNLFLKKQKDVPMPSPNNPVVKGNIISSVGCRMKSNKIVSR